MSSMDQILFLDSMSFLKEYYSLFCFIDWLLDVTKAVDLPKITTKVKLLCVPSKALHGAVQSIWFVEIWMPC
jgi:hypothetical protein